MEGVTLLEMPRTETSGGPPFHEAFGTVATDLKGLVPIAAPEWLEESLNSPTDKRLDGKSILVNWGDEEEPNWMVGKLSAKSEWELDGVQGNFKASYAAEGTTAVHMLSAEDYANSVDGQPEHMWVLLGSSPPAATEPTQQPAAPAATPAGHGKSKSPAAPTTAAGNSSAAGSSTAPTRNAQQKQQKAPPSPAVLGKRKAPVTCTPAAGSSSAAGSSTAPTRNAQQKASPSPALDLSKLSAKQLADLQVAIAHQLQQQK
jgi:hypothetical protein